MGYREVPVYSGPFPTSEQIITGDPARPLFPKQIWLEQLNPGDFAVRYRDFKTGLARSADAKHVGAAEQCRIFPNLDEARSNSREIVNAHPSVICVLCDHTGAEVDRISNRHALNKFAASFYTGILIWGAIYSLAGMAVLLLLYRTVLLLGRIWWPEIQPAHSLKWTGRTMFVVAGLLLSVVVCFLRLHVAATRRVAKIRSQFSAEDRKRFGEINDLPIATDPATRERLLKLYKEFQQKVGEATKK